MTAGRDIVYPCMNGFIGGCKIYNVTRMSQDRLENYGVGIALYIEYKMDNLCKQY